MDISQKFERARFLRQTGRLQLANKELREGLQLVPDHPVLLTELSNVLMQMGSLEDAEEAAHAAILYAPEFFPAHWALADALDLVGRYEESLEAIYRAIELAPECAPLYSDAALTNSKLSQLSQAWTLANKAIALEPENKHCLLIYAQLCILYGRGSKARVLLEDLQELYPECSRVRKMLAVLDHKSGLFRQSQRHAKEALELNPECSASQAVHSSAKEKLRSRGDFAEHYPVSNRDLWPSDPSS